MARLSWTSGLLSPPRPPSAGVGRRAGGRGAGDGGGARHVERRAGAGGAWARAGLFKGAPAEPGEAALRPQAQARADLRDAQLRPPTCAARCVWRWQRRSCMVKPPVSPATTLAPWDPRRLGAPRAGDGIGDSRLLRRAAGGAAGGRRAQHFWAALLGRLGVRAGGASPPACPEQPARLSSPLLKCPYKASSRGSSTRTC